MFGVYTNTSSCTILIMSIVQEQLVHTYVNSYFCSINFCVRCNLDCCNCSLCSDIFKTKKFPNNDFILNTNHNISAKFSGETGLLKSVSIGSTEVVLDLDFVSYGTRSGKDKSGAYLFLPDKEASSIISSRKKNKIITIAGPLVSISFLRSV